MPKSYPGQKKSTLDTPCLVIDRAALENNLDTMRRHALAHNIQVRPHCKTHKCSRLARLQMEYGAIGISAAKVSEAEVLVNAGISGVLLTSPVVTADKIARFMACVEKSPDIMVVVDNEKNIRDLGQAGESIKRKINVLVDLDSGIGRTGTSMSNALDFALKIQQTPWLNLAGIQCYAGNLQHIASFDERKKASLRVMQEAAAVVKNFKRHGLPCSILTGSGTGTFDIDTGVPELTEIQPGSYAVMDVEYAAIGSRLSTSFTTFSPAMTLLTTVISSNRAEHVTVDAGTKSIYTDNLHRPKIISHKGLQYDWGGFGDEHGKVSSPVHASLPGNGEVLELIVPHCDPTINLFDNFFIVENEIVVDIWPIDLRGKSQ